MEIIKKYRNRKLYSTSTNNYVTLHYVLDEYRRGQPLKIIDNVTKTDITEKTVREAIVRHANIPVHKLAKLVTRQTLGDR